MTDYAACMGDTSPGASGSEDDFYWPGKGTGVLIAARPVQIDRRKPLPKYRRVARFVESRGFVPAQIWNSWDLQIAMTDVTDGTSNTIMVGESHVPNGQLNQSPANGPAYFGRHFTHFARIAGPGVPLAHGPGDVRASPYSFGSNHAGGVQFAFVDGSVKMISTSISSKVAGHLSTRCEGLAATGF